MAAKCFWFGTFWAANWKIVVVNVNEDLQLYC